MSEVKSGKNLKFNRERWKKLFNSWQASNQSVTKFCQANQVSPAALAVLLGVSLMYDKMSFD